MSSNKHILVTGATGNQGGAVVQALLNRGHKVRALTRNSNSAAAKKLHGQGVEIAVGAFSDYDSLVQAAQGVDAVFTMSTPFEQGIEKEIEQGVAMTKAVKAAGVGHLVFSSVASADRDTGIPHFESKFAIEEHIAKADVPYTIIAPVFFMENFLQQWMLAGLRQGKVAMAMPGSRLLQQVAVDDIGAFAATIIERGESVFGQRFDIAGDELTGEAAAAIISDASGRDIRYEGFPVEYMREQSEDMAIMFEWFDSTGYSADIKGLHRDFPEVDWNDFRKWAGKQDWGILDRD